MLTLSRTAILFFLFLAFFTQVLSSFAQQNLGGQAANPLDVVINEIAWMGNIPRTGESVREAANNEWIELYNNTNKDINLENWTLKTADSTPKINLTGIIPAKGFYLLERTNDNSVPGIPANQIYKGALKNDGENLKIYDNFGNLIDSVNCNEGWFAGDNSTRQTMERINSLAVSDTANWGMSQNPGGTPKAENSIAAKSATLSEEPTLESKPKPRTELLNRSPIIYPSESLDTPAEVKPPQIPPQIIPQIIDINAASLKKLQEITDIGPVLAQKIIEARPFYSIDELTKVRGIGPKTLENIKKQGLAWVDPELEPPKIEKIEKTESLGPGLKTVSAPFKQRDLAGEIPKSLFVFLIALVIAIFSAVIILILKKKLKTKEL